MTNVERMNANLENQDVGVALRFGNNLVVKVIGVRHNPILFDEDETLVVESVKPSDFVVVEDDGVLLANEGDSTGSTDYYQQVCSVAWKYGKDVVCGDPQVETSKLGSLDYTISNLSTIGMCASLAGIGIGISNAKNMSRKDFLKLMSLGGGALALSYFSFRSSLWGEIAVQIIKGYDVEIDHPRATDSFSYYQYRNSATLLGLDQLARLSYLTDKKGVLFVGKSHIGHYWGYTDNGKVNIDEALHVYKDNVYQRLATSGRFGLPPTIRVWSPTSAENKFELRLHQELVG